MVSKPYISKTTPYSQISQIGLCPFYISKGVVCDFLCGTLFKTWHAVKIASPQKCKGALDSINMAFVISIRVLFFLLATPLEASEYGAVVSCIIPKDWTNELNVFESYSWPLSLLFFFKFFYWIDFQLPLKNLEIFQQHHFHFSTNK